MYELSFHTAEPGAIALCRGAFHTAIGGLGAAVVGAWQADGGANPGACVSLCQWPDFAARETARAEINALAKAETAGSMISEHWIVTPVAELAEPPAFSGPAVFEMRVQDVLNGHQPQAAARFADTYAPEIEAQGGAALGQFDVTLGPGRPVFVTLLSWPHHRDMHEGWQAVENARGVARALEEDLRAHGQPLFQSANQYLLREVAR